MKKHSITTPALRAVAFLLTGLVASLLAAPPEYNSNIEEIPNSRVTVVNMQTIFDASTRNNAKVFPRIIESIAWNNTGTKLYIDYQGVNQYFAIVDLSSAIKGTARVKFLSHTRDKGNTRHNNANPVFHPSNKFYVFSGQDIGVTEYRRSLPGYGFCTNLYAADINSNVYWPLTTNVSTAKMVRGAFMPQFSPDGTTLFWTVCECHPLDKEILGRRSLMLGDFSIVGDVPQLTNAKRIAEDQLSNAFAESYGFSPDGKQLLLAGTRKNVNEWYRMDIGLYSLETNKVTFLTNRTDTWDRYAAFTAMGRKIIWSSSGDYTIPYLGIGGSQWQNEMLSELWIMNANGMDKRQLTHFNERGHSQYAGSKCYVGMVKWHPTKKNTIAFILHKQHSLNNTSSSIIIAELGNALLGGK